MEAVLMKMSDLRILVVNHYQLLIYSVTIMFLFADQNVTAPNLTAIGDYFGFDEKETDTKLGADVQLGFWLIGGAIALIVGYYCDSLVNRTLLFGSLTVIGSFSAAATYFVTTFEGFYTVRIITGVALGGVSPLLYSILADLYTKEDRVKALTVPSVCSLLGITIGQGISGLLGPTLGWRAPYLIIAMPAFLLGFVVIFTMKDPKRASKEDATIEYNEKHEDAATSHTDIYTEKIDFEKIGEIFRTKTITLLIIQGIPGCIPWGILNVYTNDFLSNDRGMSVQLATLAIILFGLGGFLGNAIGGIWGQALFNRNRKHAIYLMSGSTALGAFPMYYIWHGDTKNAFFFIVAFIAGIITAVPGPVLNALLQNVSLPECRGTVFAVYALFGDLGTGIGPAFVDSLVRDCGNKLTAYDIGVSFWILCGLLMFITTFTVEEDEAMVQQSIKSQLGKNATKGSQELVSAKGENSETINPFNSSAL